VASINFPDSPSLDQIHRENNGSWKWNGYAWVPLKGVSSGGSISGVVSINSGGTNSTAAPTAGAIAYGDGSGYAFSSTGISGQVLVCNGLNPPTWQDAPSSANNISIISSIWS